jgi:hypothetical protein
MDKFRIFYVCNRQPSDKNFPGTFEIGNRYIGRTFNDLFEITPRWGSDIPTKLIPRKIFDQYFELVKT